MVTALIVGTVIAVGVYAVSKADQVLGNIENAIRSLIAWIDSIVYGLAANLYKLIEIIADFSPFSGETINNFGTRIYTLIGLFLLFKLSFSMIKYVINPESFGDQQKGAGKLVANIMVALVLITLVPFIFGQATKLQSLIVKSDVLPKIILGINSTNAVDRENTGDLLAFTAFSTFMRIDDRIQKVSDSCRDLEASLAPGKFADITLVNDCADEFKGVFDVRRYSLAYSTMSISVLTHNEILNQKAEITYQSDGGEVKEGIYVMNYGAFVSTIVGAGLVYLLLLFCIDISVRSIKLAFLQLIAPIPIISYVDPTSAKDGMFGKWVKMCISTYAGLFIKLAALFFAVFVIIELQKAGLNNLDSGVVGFQRSLVMVFIMFGALIFAKELPKLIEQLFGIELGGSFKSTAGMLKGAVGIGRKGLATATGLGIASLGAGIGNAMAKDGKWYQKLGSGLAGAASGGARGAIGGLTSKKGIGIGAGMAGMHGATQARINREDGARFGDSVRTAMGLKDKATKEELYGAQDALLKSQQNQAAASSYLSSMEAHEGGKYKSQFDMAFDRSAALYNENGDVIADTSKHKDWGEYRRAAQEQAYAEAGLNTLNDRLNNAEKAREIDKKIAGSLLSEQQYNTYKDALVKERTETANIKAREKEISKKQDKLDLQKKSYQPKK